MSTEEKKQATLAVINALTEMAYDNGFANGVEAGQRIGFVAGVTSLQAAFWLAVYAMARRNAVRLWRVSNDWA